MPILFKCFISFHLTNFYKILPLLLILAKMLLVLAPDMLFSCEDWATSYAQERQGERFVKFCRVKSACVGDGGELERGIE